MTPAELLQAIPFAKERANVYAAPLSAAMAEFDITTPQRQAAFLAQIAHESASLRFVLEIATGQAYEGRLDLGNTVAGDGPRFKGRGLLQITGRRNYLACGAALGVSLVTAPQLLETPTLAARSAGWFWKSRGLNVHADRDQFVALTRAINGGINGLEERIQAWLVARKALGV